MDKQDIKNLVSALLEDMVRYHKTEALYLAVNQVTEPPPELRQAYDEALDAVTTRLIAVIDYRVATHLQQRARELRP